MGYIVDLQVARLTMINHVDYLVTRKWKGVILHCSQSNWGNRDVINDWHIKRGFDEIGYHFVITNPYNDYEAWKDNKPDMRISGSDCSIEIGRSLNDSGAHAKGFNRDYIGICFIGDNFFTPTQLRAGIGLIEGLMTRFKIKRENVLGHCDLPNTGKTCPNFNHQECIIEYLDQ